MRTRVRLPTSFSDILFFQGIKSVVLDERKDLISSMRVTVTLCDDSRIFVDMIPSIEIKNRDGRVELFVPKSRLSPFQGPPGPQMYHIYETWRRNCSLHEKAKITTMSAGTKRAYRIAKALLIPPLINVNTYWIKTAFLYINSSACGDRTEEPGIILRKIIEYLEEKLGHELEVRTKIDRLGRKRSYDMDRRKYYQKKAQLISCPPFHPFFNQYETLIHQDSYENDEVHSLRRLFRSWIEKIDVEGVQALVEDLVRNRDHWIASEKKHGGVLQRPPSLMPNTEKLFSLITGIPFPQGPLEGVSNGEVCVYVRPNVCPDGTGRYSTSTDSTGRTQCIITDRITMKF